MDIARLLSEESKLLPMALQLKVAEWCEVFLSKQDKVQQKLQALKKQIESKQPPKLAVLKFEVRTRKFAKEVLNSEFAELYAHMMEAREKFSQLLKCHIAKVN